MRSLFIVNDFPPILGGQSSYLYNLCRAFPSEQIVVLAPSWRGGREFDEQQKFPIIRKPYVCTIPLIEKVWKIVFPLVYVPFILKKYNIGRIYCGHVLSTGVVGLVLRKFFKKPYCVHTYSADLMEYQNYGLIKKLLICVLRHADKVTVISEYNKEQLLALDVSPDKIIKISPKIDYEKLSQSCDTKDLIEKYNLRGKKIVLSINRLVERKGNDKLIEAFPNIKQAVPDAVYVIVGSGGYERCLRKLVEQRSLKKDVLFVGSVDDEDMLRFYALCDVFVMLSREIGKKKDAEGFGIVFLEANACGKPVIGGRSGGIPDAIVDGETGLLVDPCNIDQISKAVIRLLTDQEYSCRLGAQGRRRVQAQFDWRKGIEEIKEFNET